MGENIRSFIAIELTEEVRDKLINIQANLKQAGADVKWVKKNNIHLTLKFLGNIGSDNIENVTKALEELGNNNSRFTAELSEIGAFPRMDSPRIIWIGVEKGAKKLCDIVEGLEDLLEKIGLPKEEKEFHPHITLGRVKSSFNKIHLIKKLKEITLQDKNVLNIEKLTLFKSTLTPKGPIYEVLKEINLRAR